MDIRAAYDAWSLQYDTDENKTRDLEAGSLRDNLKNIAFQRCLEIGCGTGKNTVWLKEKADWVTAVDFSEKMLAKAKEKSKSAKVHFLKADINREWDFADGLYDLITFSLVLEHIEDLDHVFGQASRLLKKGGYIYIGELHPFKQYAGSKARFEGENGLQTIQCFVHHVSDFVKFARKHGLVITNLNEYFDDQDKNSIPRILMMIFQRP